MCTATEVEVKNIIRSLLTSSPLILNVGKVKRDFKELVGYELPYKAFNNRSLEEYLRTIPDVCRVKGTGYSAQVVPVITEKTAHINDMVTKQKNNTNKNSKMRFPIRRKKTSNGSQSTNQSQRSSSRPDDYRRKRGFETSYNSNINNTINTYKQKLQTSSIKMSPINLKENGSNIRSVPQNVQKKLQTLIGNFENGIWCCDLPHYYKQMFKEELPHSNYGYIKLIDMCMELTHIFICIQPGTDDFRLYDRTKDPPSNLPQTYTISSWDSDDENNIGFESKCFHQENEVAALPKLDWSDFKTFIPHDIYEPFMEIPKQFLPLNTKTGDELDIVVVEIYDPSKFWVYLGTSYSKTQLDDLMDNMQAYYDNSEIQKQYSVPILLIQEGLYCATVIYGEYHRVRIVQVLPDSKQVRVFCIDYGTVCKVPYSQLCFLKSNFAELPAQAIRCRLCNIAPKLKDQAWPRSSCIAFRQIVNRKDTKIKIGYINWDEECIGVFLADITDATNISYVNEELVKNGDADWEDESCHTALELSNVKCKVERLYMFPTFLELEFGFVPNADEMYAYDELKVPIQFCLPQYFYRNDEERVNNREKKDYAEYCFIETIQYRKKFAPLTVIDTNDLSLEPRCDFTFFGELKEDLTKFNNGEFTISSFKLTEKNKMFPKRPVMELLMCNWDEEPPVQFRTPARTEIVELSALSDKIKESELDYTVFGELPKQPLEFRNKAISQSVLESLKVIEINKEHSGFLEKEYDIEDKKTYHKPIIKQETIFDRIDDLVDCAKHFSMDFNNTNGERPMPAISNKFHTHITDSNLTPYLNNTCVNSKSNLTQSNKSSNDKITCDNDLNFTEGTNQANTHFLQTEELKLKNALDMRLEYHFKMRIKRYVSSSENDTDGSSDDENFSIHKGLNSSECEADRKNGEWTNNDNGAFRPGHKSVSTQTDRNEADLDVFHPLPVVVPMSNSFIPPWLNNPPIFVPNCLALPIAMSVPGFPQFTRNMVIYPNQVPVPHINSYQLNTYR
ncbi:hypothetical protein GWI33_002360 [Rhynchophorus ferrugineus]|uniref:Uncharacterized protein n=1 Tax=Rhynchophorus ferrugineus TaxID=354439 RepID=A0A834MJM3_RHYFE|nr:hypothetical protein GWI33_002360 [Rhynchophorus ferrugineus]